MGVFDELPVEARDWYDEYDRINLVDGIRYPCTTLICLNIKEKKNGSHSHRESSVSEYRRLHIDVIQNSTENTLICITYHRRLFQFAFVDVKRAQVIFICWS
jgi:hypothetical protein